LHEKSRWHRLLAAIGVLKACLQFRPDVIYLNQSGSYRTALPAAKLLGLGIVAHVRIFEDAQYLAYLRPDARRLRCVIAISAAVEVEIRRFRQLESIPLYRIYDAFAPSPKAAPRLPTQASARRIACVGRLVRVKGQDVLLGALRLLRRPDPRVDCVMIGDGDADFILELKQMASDGGITIPVQWLGFVEDVAAVLSTCSVLVCPSHREPLGRVIFEAWDAGAVPVVFSGSGGAAEVVAAADGGVMYHAQEPNALMRALQEALALKPEERARLVRNGRSWMAEHCDPHMYGKAISTVLSRACIAP
jgi:glycosyltransferase involved in cell wall biosynthesis